MDGMWSPSETRRRCLAHFAVDRIDIGPQVPAEPRSLRQIAPLAPLRICLTYIAVSIPKQHLWLGMLHGSSVLLITIYSVFVYELISACVSSAYAREAIAPNTALTNSDRHSVVESIDQKVVLIADLLPVQAECPRQVLGYVDIIGQYDLRHRVAGVAPNSILNVLSKSPLETTARKL